MVGRQIATVTSTVAAFESGDKVWSDQFTQSVNDVIGMIERDGCCVLDVRTEMVMNADRLVTMATIMYERPEGV